MYYELPYCHLFVIVDALQYKKLTSSNFRTNSPMTFLRSGRISFGVARANKMSRTENQVGRSAVAAF
jgi:hypothetical protein